MSESQIVKKKPDPAITVSSMDNHRMLSAPAKEPDRPNRQRPRAGLRVAPIQAVPPGVTIGRPAKVISTVGRGVEQHTPARPTPPASELPQGRALPGVREVALVLDESERPRDLSLLSDLLSDGELALLVQLTRTFAAHAGGEALETAKATLAKLDNEIEARDADAIADITWENVVGMPPALPGSPSK